MALTPKQILLQYWGYDEFRGPQERIIQDVLDQQDVLAILPTGGGKSICFQVPALMQEGLCLVVSPLIALMVDQVENLKKRGIKVAALHSGHSAKVLKNILSDAVNGYLDILYMSPERLISQRTMDYLRSMPISLLTIDEAHCICEWGYDFRPAYLEIAKFRELRPEIPVLALTASATPIVQDDIQDKLQFKMRRVISSSLKRPNIGYHVLHVLDKEKRLRDICSKLSGGGIVYLNSRNGVERMSYFLKKSGISAEYYHAGLEMADRIKIQKNWVNNKIRIIVATNAFGMGIDKADVRFVIHLQLPMSIEAYYQESGRAGRDGLKSYAILFYNERDKVFLTDQFARSYPEETEVKHVYKCLALYFDQAAGSFPEHGFNFDFEDFVNKYDLEKTKTYYCIKQLMESGWIYVTDQIYQPSKLIFKINRDILYDLQLKNKKLDLITRTLLRTYEGLFSEFVSISERKLSQLLNIEVDDVIGYLSTLDREGIIDYQPTRNTPQLYYAKMRVKSDHLQLDKKKIEFRKERHLSRIHHVVQYVDHSACREHIILNYFGQHAQEPCGHCDLCIKKKRDKNLISLDALYQIIDDNSVNGQISIEHILKLLKRYNKNSLIDQLTLLENERRVSLNGEMIVIHKVANE